MNLRDKYNHAIQVAKGFRMDGSAQERDGKLYFTGMVNSQDEVNKIWDAIKTVPDWRNDIVGEIKINPNAAHQWAERTQKKLERSPWSMSLFESEPPWLTVAVALVPVWSTVEVLFCASAGDAASSAAAEAERRKVRFMIMTPSKH